MQERLAAAVRPGRQGPPEHVDRLVEEPGAGLVVGDVEGRLAAPGQRPVAALEERLLVEGAHVERVAGQHGLHLRAGVLESTGSPQQAGAQAEGPGWDGWAAKARSTKARPSSTRPSPTAISARAVSQAAANAPSQAALPKAASAPARSPRRRSTTPSR